MAMHGFSAYKRQVCSLVYEFAATWHWPTLAQMNHSELLHMAGAVGDSTVNIFVVITIIIINLHAMECCWYFGCCPCVGALEDEEEV